MSSKIKITNCRKMIQSRIPQKLHVSTGNKYGCATHATIQVDKMTITVVLVTTQMEKLTGNLQGAKKMFRH